MPTFVRGTITRWVRFGCPLALTAVALLFAACQHPDGASQSVLAPFEKGGQWGYQDHQGKVIIAPRFQVAQEFSSHGIAAVVDDAGWAYIDKRGNVLIRPFIFDNGPDYFREGLARFTRQGKFGFFDESGKVVIEPQFDFALPFSEGLAAFCDGCKEEADGEHRSVKGGKWGFINRNGDIKIPAQFEEARSFEAGRAQVKSKGQWRSINKKGEFMPEKSIGVATMKEDGTIVLDLRAEGAGGVLGDARMTYPPGHAQYADVLRHLGGLKRGESKPVPPWPER
jgi:hypothetical protein